MMRRKKLFTTVLSFFMMLSLLPSGVLAEEEAPPEDYTAEEEVILPEELPEETPEEGFEELLTTEEEEEEPAGEILEEEPEEALTEEELPEEITEEEPAPEADPEAEEEPLSEPEEEPAEVTEEKAVSAEEYDLWIGDLQVTAANKNSITGDGISGTVRYDGGVTGGTLYLDSALILTLGGPNQDTYGTTGIFIGEGMDVTISLTNQNQIFRDYYFGRTAIMCRGNLTITGTGSLSIPADGFCGINCANDLTISDTTVNSYGTNYSIRTDGTCLIENSIVNVNAHNIGLYCKHLTIEGESKVTVYTTLNQGNTTGTAVTYDGDNSITLGSGIGLTEPEDGYISWLKDGGSYTVLQPDPDSNFGFKKATYAVFEKAWAINVKANNDKRGTVKGTAYFKVGATGKKATVTAMPKEGCTFLNWTEDGTVVSTDPEYTFTVTGDRELVANFGSPWTGLQKAFNQGGEFALEADLTAEEDDLALEVPAGKSVILELNGHTLNRNLSEPKDNGSVIINNGTLTISDKGTLTGGYSGNSGTGGAITNNGTLTIEGGTFTGNRSWEAGAVYNSTNATLTVNDGEFINNTATDQGGGAFVNYGKMTFAGGTIKNNTSTRHGGAIWTRGDLRITGGRIVENTAHGDAGGINVNSGVGKIEIYGNPQIIDNYPNNVLIPSNNMVYISDVLSAEARIGLSTNASVSAGTPKVITSGLEGHGTISSFIDDNEAYTLLPYNGEAAFFAGFPEENITVKLAQEYVAVPTVLAAESFEFEASVEPEEWRGLVTWYAEDDNGNPPADVTVVPNGAKCSVTVQKTTTFWVIAEIRLGEKVYGQARCRVDVKDFTEDRVPNPIAYDLENKGNVRLLSKSASTKLYSTEYTKIQVLPELSQNNKTTTQAAPNVVPQPDPAPGTGVAITAAAFDDEETAKRFFLRVADDRTLEVIPTNEALTGDLAVAKSYNSVIKLTIDGTEFKTEKLKLTVNKSLPTIKAKAVTVNSYMSVLSELTFTGGTVLPGHVNVNLDKTSPDWLTLIREGDNIGLIYTGEQNAAKKGKLYLQVQPEGWAVKRDVVVNVTSKSTPPTMVFKSKTLTVKPGTRDMASTTFTMKPAYFTGAPIEKIRVTENGNDVEGEPLLVVINDNTVSVTANPTDGKAHTYKVLISVFGKESILTVKTLADSKAVTLKLTAKGAIDLTVPNSPVTITASTGNIRTEKAIFRLTGITDKSGSDMNGYFDVKQSGNVFTITQNYEYLYKGTFIAKIQADYGNGTVEKTVKFTVKESKSAPASLTLKTKGSIDVLRPGTAVTVTPAFKNLYEVDLDKEVSVTVTKTYDGASKKKVNEDVTDLFYVDLKDGKTWQITPKPGAALSHKDKFAVKAEGPGVSSKAVTLKVVQGKSKVKQSTKSVTLLKKDCYSEGKVKLSLTDAKLKGIQAVVLVSPKDSLKRDIFRLADLGGGEYAIQYNDSLMPANIAKLKTQTVKLKVYLEGNETLTPNATLTVKVNFK